MWTKETRRYLYNMYYIYDIYVYIYIYVYMYIYIIDMYLSIYDTFTYIIKLCQKAKSFYIQ